MAKSEKSPSVEENLKAIGEIVSRLESGDLTLEESLKQYEKGVKLVRSTNESLTKAEERIQILSGEEDK